jgi:hypothetical protein
LAVVTTTLTLPGVKLEGTVTAIDPSVQLVIVAGVLPKVTVPCVEPNPEPLIVVVTEVPSTPEEGFMPLIVGLEAETVNVVLAVWLPAVVTTTETPLPALKLDGTVTTIA